MPSHLHPRSRLTTSLFGTTLLVSFLVVGMPHILPCPAPRADFTDVEITEDGRRRRRRRRVQEGTADGTQQGDERTSLAQMSKEAEEMARRAHECPVPKPKGVIGRLFGFEGTGCENDR